MTGYFTKLDSGITDSTVWREPDTTRLVWITLLAMADQDGYVGASVPGLADRARVSLEACLTALDCFRSPDKWSRSQEFDGRRIADVDGGWALLNHAKYRAMRDAETRRGQVREAVSRFRAKAKSDVSHGNPDVINVSHGKPVKAQADTDTEAKKKLSSSPKADDQTELAITAYNRLLAKPCGLLPKVTKVGREKRSQQVRRVLKTALEISAEEYQTIDIPAQFWDDYFGACSADPFLSGRQGGGKGHENWKPDFDYLTKIEVMLKVYDRMGGDERAD